MPLLRKCPPASLFLLLLQRSPLIGHPLHPAKEYLPSKPLLSRAKTQSKQREDNARHYPETQSNKQKLKIYSSFLFPFAFILKLSWKSFLCVFASLRENSVFTALRTR